MIIHIKENDLRSEKCENKNKNEFGIHKKKELVEGIIRDALRLEESLRLYMTGSESTVVQEDMGQDVEIMN